MIPAPAVALSMSLQQWEEFRAGRNRSLPAPHGWLSLTSLQWLPERPGSLNSLPGLWSAADGVAQLRAAAADGLLLVHGGTAVDGVVSAKLAENESLNWVRCGNVLVELALRGGAYAVRTRDSGAPTLTSFSAVPVYDYNPEYAVQAEFVPLETPQNQEISTANAQVPALAVIVGTVNFELAGQRHTLLAEQNGDGLLLNFHDASNGSETADWRFLSTGVPAADGTLQLDFNYALNWPSGFSAFGTCPQPVAENNLVIKVPAGEKVLAPV